MELEWIYNLSFFFGLLMLMLLSGMPVAIGFLTLNILGLYLYLGPGSLSLLADQLVFRRRTVCPHPDTAFHPDG